VVPACTAPTFSLTWRAALWFEVWRPGRNCDGGWLDEDKGCLRPFTLLCRGFVFTSFHLIQI
jgi:hypothetical protein